MNEIILALGGVACGAGLAGIIANEYWYRVADKMRTEIFMEWADSDARLFANWERHTLAPDGRGFVDLGAPSTNLTRHGIACDEIRGSRDPLFGGANPEPIEPHVEPLRQAVLNLRAWMSEQNGRVPMGDLTRLGDPTARLLEIAGRQVRQLVRLVDDLLDVSRITGLPPGRRPVRTWVTPESRRDEVYQLLHTELAAGRQAYVIYPLVEESEKVDLKAATAMDEHLRLVAAVFDQLQREGRDDIAYELRTDPSTSSLYAYGTLPGVSNLSRSGGLPIKNYTTNVVMEGTDMEQWQAPALRETKRCPNGISLTSTRAWTRPSSPPTSRKAWRNAGRSRPTIAASSNRSCARPTPAHACSPPSNATKRSTICSAGSAPTRGSCTQATSRTPNARNSTATRTRS